jgi:hypothetical protein
MYVRNVCVVLIGLVCVSESWGQRTTPTKKPVAAKSGFVEPARYPLELVSPRMPDSSPSPKDDAPTISAGHRIFRAYPGIEYNIRAVVIGGSYPYRFALSKAPYGMTIDAVTGEIRWPKPSAGQVTATITVTDAEGTTQSSAWPIMVAADSFRIVDAKQGDDSNPGTLASPWRSLAKVKASEAAGATIYFRTGVYRTTDMAASGPEADVWHRVEFNGRYHPVQWLAFPGEKPVIDNDYVAGRNQGRFIRITGSGRSPVYLDGLEITNSRHIGLQYGSGSCDFAVFRRLSIHDIAESIDGANSAGIMTLTSRDDPSWYNAYQDIDFHDNAPGGIKQYSHTKFLWEDCRFRDSGIGPDLKSDTTRFEVRGCSFTNNSRERAGLFGNMHPSPQGEISGEIRFNRMICGGSPTMLALEVNQDGLANTIHVYRNTLLGVVNVRNVDQADGPFVFTRNVIVNMISSPNHINFESVSDPSRITATDNLTGFPNDGIVDAEGNLTSAHRANIGKRGHQLPR